MMFENKKIFILGMARSGYEAAKVLATRNNQILITDMNEQKEEQVQELEDLGIKVVITKDPDPMLDKTYDYVIKNPGITFEHPVVLKANKLGIKVINELELAFSLMPKDITIIGITGSNGKTTTTTLIYEFLHAMGQPVYIGGNIGYPLCSLINVVKSGDILVLEISGHQLHDMDTFKTHISVMTNLSPVHIDFFKTYDYYKEMKTRIFNNHTKDDIAIINAGNADVMESTLNIKSTKITFSSIVKADAYLLNDAIYYKDELIININDIRIQGNHNYENIMCAIIASKEFGITNETIHEVLSNFSGVEHRIEFVRKLNDREFYNDSKSTNVESTIVALKAFTKPVILLLGGLDRGHSFADLTPFMTHVKKIVSLGATNKRIKEYADTINIDCVVVNTIEEAVKAAYNLSDAGDVILLSPACASWDQYKSFEVRGEDFKKQVEELK